MLFAGIRAGKTHVGALKTIIRAIRNPTAEDECHAVISPTYPMARLGPVPKLKKILGDKRIFPASPLVRYHKTEHTFYVLNSAGTLSKIRIFTGDDPDRWRGDKWLSAWFDEGAYLTDNAWDVGQGRLADSNGDATITTTPNGANWVADLADKCTEEIPRSGYVARRSPKRDLFLVQFPSQLNSFIADLAYFERLKENFDPETYDQEVRGLVVARSGRVYRRFDRTKHLQSIPLDRTKRLYVGQDFNVDPLVSALMQDSPTGAGYPPRSLHVLGEFCLRDADTYKLVARTKEWCRANSFPERMVTFYPDASGRKRSTSAANAATASDIKIIQQHFKVEAPRANPRVKDRVNSVNGLFYNGRLTVDPGCSEIIAALEKQPWGKDGEPEKDGWKDNFTDALGYAVWGLYPLRRETSLGQKEAA